MCKGCSKSNEQMEPTDNKLFGPNGEERVGSCLLQTVSPERRTTRQDSSNSPETSLSGPTVSLISIDSSVSNSSDYSVDCNPLDGDNSEQGLSRSCQDDAYKQQSKSSPFVAAVKQSGDEREIHRGDKGSFGLVNGENSKTLYGNDDTSRNKNDSADEENDPSPTFDVEDELWDPPEPENGEDERESVKAVTSLVDSDDEGYNQENSMAVANLDDDKDGCANCDGIELTKPSSLSNSEIEVSRSHCFEEERQNAMLEVMNGKFKNLVRQLLKKIGIDNCDDKEESWVDIVTQLAWEAALFVKPDATEHRATDPEDPDATEGKAMDPAGYVKVKCIASGSRSESQLIKGLVFKKHAALKNMITMHKRPRLLLVKGMLQSSASSGLASFNSMVKPIDPAKQPNGPNPSFVAQDQDENEDADLLNNLKACRPNVILVEKSASRKLLSHLLQSGITVVLDMKFHRLQRVARCIDAPILSSEAKFDQKLKRCESLHFEKFVEEHANVREGEKKPCKTLMFLEGCPTGQGCTILLKGSHSEELKKIKCVVQCAVVMAYHFILETSFLVHQKVMFSTLAFGGVADISLANEQFPSIVSETSSMPHGGQSNISCASANEVDVPKSDGYKAGSSQVEESTSETASSRVLKIPISNVVHEEKSAVAEGATAKAAVIDTSHYLETETHDARLVVGSQPAVSYVPHTMFKDALERVSIISPSTYEQVSTYISLSGGEPKANTAPSVSVSVSPTEELANRGVIEMKVNSGEDLANYSQALSTSCAAHGDARKIDDGEDYIQPKDEISSVLDSESILVLMSSRNASRGTICEQSHLSHIKFYRNFDVPLGKFLRDNLFNQSLPCKACGESPEAHYYYYAHHKQQLTIRVKRLLEKKLPGESEGKLWMWSRCGKCEPDKEKATKRVLISTAASVLSFGKFLELSFSSQSSFNRLSTCGHSLQKDFLYFFGLGSMVAMFRYSRVATYTVSVPPQKLEFNNSVNGDWLQQEIESVYAKGQLLFTEIGKYLKKIESQFSGSDLVLNSSSKAFDDILEMLRLERSEFEEKIKDCGIKNDESCNAVRVLLRLNQLQWEILLEACIWEQRLHLLRSSSNLPHGISTNGEVQRQMELKRDINDEGEANEGSQTPSEKEVLGELVLEEPRSRGQVGAKKEAADEGEPRAEEAVTAGGKIVRGQTSLTEQNAEEIGVPGIVDAEQPNIISEGKEFYEKRTDVDVQIKTVAVEDKHSVRELSHGEMLQGGGKQDLMRLLVNELEIDQGSISGDSVPSVSLSQESESSNHPSPLHPETDDLLLPADQSEDESLPRNGHGEDNSSKLDKNAHEVLASVASSNSESSINWVWNPFGKIREECMKDLQKGSTPKFGHSPKFGLLQALEFSDDVSQVIMEEGSRLHIPLSCGDYIVSDYDGEISSSVACALASWNELNPGDNASLERAASVPSDFPLQDSSDRDMIISAPSMPSTESLVPHGPTHPEVSLGTEKYPPKGKYSVIILYAEKFRDLRKDCCLSELDFIASLSRCKFWDAKGGKSKSLFAKTLDERLIIKEIKKTEYESFMKFANNYFEYMKQSFKLGNQTCLAKILGIYQVTIRHPKGAKETKHDIMVQENLSFGRNITRQYDLKGALHARFTATADGTGDVLLDQNFVNDMNSSPLYVGQKAKRLLQRAVWNDTTFLTSINVMDYSLLVGVDRQRKELVCGIIDYLRQYTWDKQLETWVKISLVTPKNMLPTIISPKEYKKRFRKFMDTHFLTVPDNWCSQRSSNPCKLCGIRSGDSSPVKSEKQPEQLNGIHADD